MFYPRINIYLLRTRFCILKEITTGINSSTIKLYRQSCAFPTGTYKPSKTRLKEQSLFKKVKIEIAWSSSKGYTSRQAPRLEKSVGFSSLSFVIRQYLFQLYSSLFMFGFFMTYLILFYLRKLWLWVSFNFIVIRKTTPNIFTLLL